MNSRYCLFECFEKPIAAAVPVNLPSNPLNTFGKSNMLKIPDGPKKRGRPAAYPRCALHNRKIYEWSDGTPTVAKKPPYDMVNRFAGGSQSTTPATRKRKANDKAGGSQSGKSVPRSKKRNIEEEGRGSQLSESDASGVIEQENALDAFQEDLEAQPPWPVAHEEYLGPLWLEEQQDVASTRERQFYPWFEEQNNTAVHVMPSTVSPVTDREEYDPEPWKTIRSEFIIRNRDDLPEFLCSVGSA